VVTVQIIWRIGFVRYFRIVLSGRKGRRALHCGASSTFQISCELAPRRRLSEKTFILKLIIQTLVMV